MLLHFIIDDKFIDDAVDLFESVSSGKNTYVLLTEKELGELQLIYIKKNINVIHVVSFNSSNWVVLLSTLRKYKAILFHSLFGLNQRVLEQVNFPENTKIVWFCWGGDGYRFNPSFLLYLSQTSKLLQEIDQEMIKADGDFVKQSNLALFFKIRNKMRHAIRNYLERKKVRNFLKKIDYFIPVTPSDFLVLRSLLRKDVKIMRFSYGSSDQFTKGIVHSGGLDDKKNILIGNSCNPSNNHFEAINILSNINFEDVKVYIPLSYPLSMRNLAYRERILQKASSVFNDNFFPLNDFLPKNKYNQILSTCKLAVFYHLRQQAKGNILTALFAGCIIIMNDHSPLYKDLISEGFKIYTLNDLDNIEINWEVILANRVKLEEIYGHERVLSYTSDLVAELIN